MSKRIAILSVLILATAPVISGCGLYDELIAPALSDEQDDSSDEESSDEEDSSSDESTVGALEVPLDLRESLLS